MSKPIPKVRSKKVGDLRLRLTTYQSEDRGGMIELVSPENTEIFALDEVIFEAHYMRQDNAEDQYRKLRTSKQAIDWAWRNS